MTVELVTDDGTYFLPKYIEKTNAPYCECALNSGIPEKMQTMHKYCKTGEASADTAYARIYASFNNRRRTMRRFKKIRKTYE